MNENGQKKSNSMKKTLCIVLSFLFSLQSLFGIKDVALDAYNKKMYERAYACYKRYAKKLGKPELTAYNMGSAAYKMGELDTAKNHFLQAMEYQDPVVHGKALYNLGNTYFRLGENIQKKDIQKTIGYWQEAIKLYQEVSNNYPELINAPKNLEIVKERLEAIKKQNTSSEESSNNTPDTSSQKDIMDKNSSGEDLSPKATSDSQDTQITTSQQGMSKHMQEQETQKLLDTFEDTEKRFPQGNYNHPTLDPSLKKNPYHKDW